MPPATGINFSSWFLVGFIFRTRSFSLSWVALSHHIDFILQNTFSVNEGSDGGQSLILFFRPVLTLVP